MHYLKKSGFIWIDNSVLCDNAIMSHRTASAAPKLALEWGVKQSLVRYVAEMRDGSIVVTEPATAVDAGYRFPVAAPAREAQQQTEGTLRFTGSVTLTAHGGMLRLVFAEPWLVPATEPNGSWALTIADPHEPGARIAFATIDSLAHDGTAHGTRLTAEGADLFFAGPYTEGTELDDPRILGRA